MSDQGFIKQDSIDNMEDRSAQEIVIRCVNCHRKGGTRMLFTAIPHFDKVVIMSTNCSHCRLKLDEILPTSEIHENGVSINVLLETPDDLVARRVLKTAYASCKFVEIDVNVPSSDQGMTTIEKILMTAKKTAENALSSCVNGDTSAHERIEATIRRINEVLDGKAFPLSFEINDPSGNSFVERFPEEDASKWVQRTYLRTPGQSHALGLNIPEDVEKGIKDS